MILQRLFGEALTRFDEEHEANKLKPEFQYKWASCLRIIGAETESKQCLTQVLMHYASAPSHT